MTVTPLTQFVVYYIDISTIGDLPNKFCNSGDKLRSISSSDLRMTSSGFLASLGYWYRFKKNSPGFIHIPFFALICFSTSYLPYRQLYSTSHSCEPYCSSWVYVDNLFSGNTLKGTRQSNVHASP